LCDNTICYDSIVKNNTENNVTTICFEFNKYKRSNADFINPNNAYGKNADANGKITPYL